MADRARQAARVRIAAKSGRQPRQIPNATSVIDMDSLGRSIGYRMRRAQVAIFQDIIKAFADHDIRPAQFSAMVLMGANPGLNQSEIAAALGIKRTNFVSLIDSLEHRGLAERTPTEIDRRSYALHLTAAGTTLLTRLQAIQAEHEARVVARIGPHGCDQLLAMLGAISELAGDDPVDD